MKTKIAARSIQAIRSYNSKQYTSATFNRFCKESRIHHQLTVPYTPQQSDDISSEHKDDIVARKNTDEESKLLRACSNEASQIDKKISIAATQKQKFPNITQPVLNAKVVHNENKSLVVKIHAALELMKTNTLLLKTYPSGVSKVQLTLQYI